MTKQVNKAPLKCTTCGTIYGAKFGPVIHEGRLWYGGSSRLHLCMGKSKGNVVLNDAGKIDRRKGFERRGKTNHRQSDDKSATNP